jgi:hypothetical protein
MKVYVSDRGDRSVGINPNTFEAELNWDYPDKEDREQLREAFVKFARENLDFGYSGKFHGTQCIFGDECGECSTILNADGSCPNKSCFNNPEFQKELEESADLVVEYPVVPKEEQEANTDKQTCFFCDKVTKTGRNCPMDKREKGDGLFGSPFICYECISYECSRL